MRWFSGSIVEAVNLSKSRNAIFVVFVDGDNDNSKEMNKMLEDERVTTRLESEKFVVVKIKSGTQDYMQFAQIYQIVPVPSLFFIGKNGTPLEVIGSGLDTVRLISKIDLLTSGSGATSGLLLDAASASCRPSTSSEGVSMSSQNLIASEIAGEQQATGIDLAAPDGSTGASKINTQGDTDSSVTPPKRQKSEEFEVICDGDVCVRKPKIPTVAEDSGANAKVDDAKDPAAATSSPESAEQTSSADASLAALEERLKKAQDLIEQKRREKDEKEKDEEKSKEVQRRQTGKGVAELKRWQEEQEMKSLQEERRREKLENEKARAKILEQIAQDRAERRTRDPTGTPNAAPVVSAPVIPPPSVLAGTEARIQFKLTDGTSKVAKFSAESTLSELRDYVRTVLQIKSPFALWMMFPRRAFTDDENDRDLSALGLLPSAVLLVVGEGTSTGSKPSSGPPAKITSSFNNIYNVVIQLFWSLFVSPVQFAWSWINGGSAARRGAEKRRRSADGQPSGSSSDGRSPAQARRPGDNVRRLRDPTPPPDDNNTWNGNSTQQM